MVHMGVWSGLHFVAWKDGDGAFGWNVAAEIACDVFAGEVGDWAFGE
jgi:hypothetical protein